MGITGGFPTGNGADVIGNGFVVNNRGQLSAKPFVAVSPVILRHPDGIGGMMQITAQPPNHPLFTVDKLDGNVTTDQAVQCFGADTYIIRRIVFLRASITPTVMQGGVYTKLGKTGRAIVPATQLFTALNGPKATLTVDFTDPVVMRAPWLYFSLTTAQGAALSLSMRVYGDVVDALPG